MIFTNMVLLTGQGDHMQILVSDTPNRLSLPGVCVDMTPLNALHKQVLVDQVPLNALRKRVPVDQVTVVPLTPRYHVSNQQHALVIVPYVDWVPEVIEVKGCRWVYLNDTATQFVGYAATGSIVCEALSRFWGFMPNADSRLSKITVYGGHSHTFTSRLTFFGGSFDPLHSGHLATLKNAMTAINIERLKGIAPRSIVTVVPDTNPQKDNLRHRCAWESYQELRKSLSILNDDAPLNCKVYPGFINMRTPNPTARWVTRIDSKYSVDFVIGQDHLHTLPDWDSSVELLKRINTLFVSPRDDVPEHSENADIVKKSTRIYWLPKHDAMHVSSTKIREGQKV